MTLAANHILDYGAQALEECRELLDKAGIQHAGAGLNLTDAFKPAILQTAIGQVAVVAITDNEPAWKARENTPGVNFVDYDVNGQHEPYKGVFEHVRTGGLVCTPREPNAYAGRLAAFCLIKPGGSSGVLSAAYSREAILTARNLGHRGIACV